MSRYFVVDENRELLREIKEEQYESYKSLNNKLQDYSNIFDCFINLKKSEESINNYLDIVSKNRDKPLEEMYADCKFIFLINIMFGRILIDNMKAYCKKVNREKLLKYIQEIEGKDELRMLKLLRNFGQHHSLPFSNFKVKTDIINEKTDIDILIDKKIIQNNFSLNRKDREYINTFNEEEISIVTYYKIWINCLNNVFQEFRNDFLTVLKELEKKLLLNLFIEFFDDRSDSSVQGLVRTTSVNINFLTVEEIVPINFVLIKDLIREVVIEELRK